jgi:uncharacterized protein YdeI (YjbR/CyaY-like superfamily)
MASNIDPAQELNKQLDRLVMRFAMRTLRNRVGCVLARAIFCGMNERVDRYIARSTKWPEEMAELRSVLLNAGLEEDIKWGKPCFSFDGHNIAIIQEMNDFLSLMFFKGALLKDKGKVLVEQGPNSRSAKRIEFLSLADVTRLKRAIKVLIKEAIDVEEAGLTVEPAPELVLAEELQMRLASDRNLKAAFEALTPGRQREYNLYISSAKQAKTRIDRVDAFAPKILAGKGFRDS